MCAIFGMCRDKGTMRLGLPFALFAPEVQSHLTQRQRKDFNPAPAEGLTMHAGGSAAGYLQQKPKARSTSSPDGRHNFFGVITTANVADSEQGSCQSLWAHTISPGGSTTLESNGRPFLKPCGFGGAAS